MKGISAVGNSRSTPDSISRKQVVLGNDFDADNLLIELSVLHDKRGELEDPIYGVFVLIIDPNNSTQINQNGLKALYNLTSAELDVAQIHQ